MIKKLIFVLLAIGISLTGVYAEKSPSKPEKRPIDRPILVTLGKKAPQMRTPSRIFLEGEITETGIVFYPADWYTMICVTITNDESGEEWSGVSSDQNEVIPFDAEEGYYNVRVQTSDGNILYGGFEL